MHHATLLLAVVAAHGSLTGQLFDLADACRGGTGTLPGTGPADQYAINRARTFLAQPSFRFVDGVFVPLEQGTTVIDSKGGTFDFSASVQGTGTNGTPANGLGVGALRINDPSRLAGNPDYTGDPANHSIMACHASVGITFDMVEVRKVFPGAVVFQGNAGASCGGFVNYFVLVDGVLAASGVGLNQNRFQPVRVVVPPTAQYLTLAIGDDNRGTINCAHGYWGDPFLGCGWSTFGQGGNDSTATQVQVRATGCPQIGTTVRIGAELGRANQAPIAVFLGGSTTRWLNFTLPFDLTPLGAPGNRILVALDFFAGAVQHGGGGGTLALPIPNDPLLRGQTAYAQAVVADLRANAFGFVTSNALEMRIQ